MVEGVTSAEQGLITNVQLPNVVPMLVHANRICIERGQRRVGINARRKAESKIWIVAGKGVKVFFCG